MTYLDCYYCYRSGDCEDQKQGELSPDHCPGFHPFDPTEDGECEEEEEV